MPESNSNNQSFGTAIKTLRQQRRLGMSELAKRSGINRQHLYRIEDDENVPSDHTLVAIADALELDPEDLYDLAWETNGAAPGLPSMATYFRAKYDLTDEQIAQAEQAISSIAQKKPPSTT